MAKVKAANYSDAQIAVLKESYKGLDNKAEVDQISAATGKTPASVRAKLAQLGLYKAEKAEAKNADRVSKRVLAESIGERLALLEAEVDGLEKAPKSVLEKLVARLG